jgi:hypothetical protein
MIISLTYLKLKSIWKFFPLSYNAMHIVRQTRAQEGFVKMKSMGFGYHHYTLSVWDGEKDLKEFSRSGAHLRAMKKSNSLASEIRIYTYHDEKIPSWKEVKAILREKGKVFTFK